ncbi:hypothetical protein OIU76_005707 [Salix suchowensis]|nr:hypothetical protein OIU76_005707 [Salix suchowensis]
MVKEMRFSSVVETPVPANEETGTEALVASLPVEVPLSNDFAANDSQISLPGKCDLFAGDWMPDPSGPFLHKSELPRN